MRKKAIPDDVREKVKEIVDRFNKKIHFVAATAIMRLYFAVSTFILTDVTMVKQGQYAALPTMAKWTTGNLQYSSGVLKHMIQMSGCFQVAVRLMVLLMVR